MSEVIYFNGSLVPSDQAVIHSSDSGFLYGYGLFETMRAYNGRVFMLDKHLERLRLSSRRLGLGDLSEEISIAVRDVIQANNLNSARIRVTVTAGNQMLFSSPVQKAQPTLLVSAVHYSPLPANVYQKGFSAIISSFRRCSSSPVSQMKTISYLDCILAKHEAAYSSADEAILLNEMGNVCEASMSNLFLVKNNALLTPSVCSGLLPGITRGVVLDIAQNLKIKTAEIDIEKEDLYTAEEIFLTNSLIEIMPLTKIDDASVGTGKPGRITRLIMKHYQKIVSTETLPNPDKCD